MDDELTECVSHGVDYCKILGMLMYRRTTRAIPTKGNTMNTKFIAAGNKEVTTLEELVETLDNAREIKIFVDSVQVSKIRFPKAKEGTFRNRFPAQILLHGERAGNIKQVIRYIEGDAHDRSKVQFLSPGKGFKNFF